LGEFFGGPRGEAGGEILECLSVEIEIGVVGEDDGRCAMLQTGEILRLVRAFAGAGSSLARRGARWRGIVRGVGGV